MMQSSGSSDEQEIVFDDEEVPVLPVVVEETNDNGGAGALHPATRNAPLSDPLRNFQPLLLAGNSAARHLESFLSSPDDDANAAAAASSSSTTGTPTPTGHLASVNTTPSHTVYSYPVLMQTASVVQNAGSTVSTSHSAVHAASATPKSTTRMFDPYSSPHRHVADASLLDTTPNEYDDDDYSDDDDDDNNNETLNVSTVTDGRMPHVPGSAGFLEMEAEPPRTPVPASRLPQHASANGIYDPITTTSGLLLTHRRVPVTSMEDTMEPLELQHRTRARSQFELEGGKTASKNRTHTHPYFPYTASGTTGNNQQSTSTSAYTPYTSSYTTPHAFRTTTYPPLLLRYVRMGVVVSALVLLTGTVVLVHHAWSGGSGTTTSGAGNKGATTQAKLTPASDPRDFVDTATNFDLIPLGEDGDFPDRIILLPFPPDYAITQNVRNNPSRHRRLEPLRQRNDLDRLVGVQAFSDEETVQQRPRLEQTRNNARRPPKLAHMDMLPSIPEPLTALRDEFHAWMQHHNKTYHSSQEHKYRFNIWSDNHHKTALKNERHGPCQMTGKAVFGSTHTQDLTPDEFKSTFLNGYNLKREPLVKGDEPAHPVVLDPSVVVPNRHPDVQKRLLKQQEQHGPLYTLNYRAGCKWYDVSCHLRYIFSTYLYRMGGTMEPRYDADSYPIAVDWRSLGAVTDVHSQGSCGACWAITAVETAESAYFIAKGTLYDLAETEVIVCAGCELCAGGWPQDAFDYIIRNNGLPLESVMSYSADYLLLVSNQVAGTSDELNSDTVKAYQQTTCPSGGNGGGGGGGNSGDAAVVSGSNTYSRYGKIKGYGYSTAKCVCYTDGSGCDCDKQNEGYAVRNLATYGPAVVCLDASTWQDYTEGIITSDSGCSSGFMDVNHCVQAVGYAYLAEGEEAGDGSGDKGSNSRSSSGSKDSSQRQGYWIVRNQWSKYWGMNGYAYVAMGDNTCGILNDMLQAYT